jgi:NAD(P)-dependent dehydrogenase (short-subunit alcohol dehydrogenase family)
VTETVTATVTGTGRLAGKRCLITGGSRGLGRSLALAFARQGAKVAFTYRRNQADADEARALLQQLGTEPLVFQGSVADAAHAQLVVKQVVAAWGGVDVLVNNAGISQVLPIALLEEADWDEMMDVNVKGAYLFARAALRPMIRARAGRILNVGAFTSERVLEASVHYAAAKSALRGLTEALAREVGRYGITVNLLAPGLLDVGLARMLPQHRLNEYTSQSALGRLGTAEEIAALAVFLASDASAVVTGAKLVADGGL